MLRVKRTMLPVEKGSGKALSDTHSVRQKVKTCLKEHN